MTRSGYDKLKEELERLKRIERPAIIKAIAEARAHGDLSENAEYHAAREKQSFTEGRINDLDGKVGAGQGPYLGAGAAGPHPHRQARRRHGHRAAAGRQEDVRHPRGQLPLDGVNA